MKPNRTILPIALAFAVAHGVCGATAANADYFARRDGFSWERVPTCFHFGKRQADMTDAEIDFVASHTNFVVLEKGHGAKAHGSTEAGVIATANRLKARNPEIKIYFYLNAFICWPGYDALKDFNPSWYLRGLDGRVVTHSSGTPRPDVSNPAMRDWWAHAVVRTLKEGHLDGVFADALPQLLDDITRDAVGAKKQAELVSGMQAMLDLAKSLIGPDKVILANGTRGSAYRQLLDWPAIDGVMIEHFDILKSTASEDLRADLETMRLAAEKEKFVVLKGWPGFTWLEKDKMALPDGEKFALARQAITFPLAAFLAVAEPGDAFCYSWGYNLNDGFLGDYPELDHPLGPPTGDAVWHDDTATRGFAHASVFVDLKAKTARIDWK